MSANTHTLAFLNDLQNNPAMMSELGVAPAQLADMLIETDLADDSDNNHVVSFLRDILASEAAQRISGLSANRIIDMLAEFNYSTERNWFNHLRAPSSINRVGVVLPFISSRDDLTAWEGLICVVLFNGLFYQFVNGAWVFYHGDCPLYMIGTLDTPEIEARLPHGVIYQRVDNLAVIQDNNPISPGVTYAIEFAEMATNIVNEMTRNGKLQLALFEKGIIEFGYTQE